MEVDAVGSIQGRASQSTADVWAAKLAEKLDQMRANSQPATSPNVTTSASYSPAIAAQMASYQVYTQAGSIAALTNGHSNAHAAHKVDHHHPEDIKAIDALEGSTVSTLA
jgi:hypothetical protein